MKTLGLLGGMSWESTQIYYQAINREVRERLGGLHSAELLLASIDFAPIAALQAQGRWPEAGAVLAGKARLLEQAGAAALVLCTNTMHKVADAIESSVDIPLLHIADATGAAIGKQGLQRVGLLATRFTMEEEFYRARLGTRFGLEVLVPDASDRAEIHRVIYDELCQGAIRQESKRNYLGVIDRLIASGAEALILGCTEIGLLLQQDDVPVPVFDTCGLHAKAAVEFALA